MKINEQHNDSIKFLSFFGPEDGIPNQNNAPVNQPQVPQNNGYHPNGNVSHVMDPSAVSAIQAAARKEEKDKLYKQQETLKRQAREAEEREAKTRKELEEMKSKSLPVDEKVQKQLSDMQKLLEDERNARIQAERNAQQEALERYRSDLIADARSKGIDLIPEYVMGANAEEIHASINLARAEYQRLEQEILSRHQARFNQNQPGQPYHTPSPYFIPPPVMAAGLPSVVNPQPSSEQTLDMNAFQNLTSEEAVRNGDYSKARNKLMSMLRGSVPTGTAVPVGSNPRFMPPPAPNYPGNPSPVQVPQWMGGANPPSPQPQYPQYPVPQSSNYSNPYPQNQSIPSTMPNPVAQPPFPGSNGVPNPLSVDGMAAQIRAEAAAKQNPAMGQVFSNRFQPTPPIKPQG